MSFYLSEQSKGLNNLSDVNITTPKNHEVLMHNGTEWENSNVLKEQEVVPSKNLLENKLVTETDRGVTFTVSNDVITLSGTSGANIYKRINIFTDGYPNPLRAGQTYKLVGCPVNTSNVSLIIQANSSDLATDSGSGTTFTLPAFDRTKNSFVYISIPTGKNVDGIVIKPMITTDITATYADYEPYYIPIKDAMWSKEQQKKNGAYNICPNNATSQVVNQITYTVNSSNKTISATWSTTPSGNSPLLIAARGLLKLKAGITYKLLGCPSGGGWSAGNFKYRVFIQDNTAGTDIQDIGSGFIFTPTSDHEYTVYIAIAQHAGASGNLIFKPMVTTDLNATYDDYVPYAMTNSELTESVVYLKNKPVLLATAAANQTWAAQLTLLKTTYDTLTDAQKKRTFISIASGYNDQALANTHVGIGGFGGNICDSTGQIWIYAMRMLGALASKAIVSTSGTLTFINVGATTNTSAMTLWLN